MSTVRKLLSALLIIFAVWNYFEVYQWTMIIKKHHFEEMTWTELAAYSLDPVILRFCFASLLIIGTVKSWLSQLIGCFIYLSFEIYRKSTFAYEFYQRTLNRIYHYDSKEPIFLQKILIDLGKTNNFLCHTNVI